MCVRAHVRTCVHGWRGSLSREKGKRTGNTGIDTSLVSSVVRMGISDCMVPALCGVDVNQSSIQREKTHQESEVPNAIRAMHGVKIQELTGL